MRGGGGGLIEDLRNVVKSFLKSFLFEKKKKKKKKTYKVEERENKFLLALLRKNFPTDLYEAIF